eukprot:746875-Hanusia_phi.AAC.2
MPSMPLNCGSLQSSAQPKRVIACAQKDGVSESEKHRDALRLSAGIPQAPNIQQTPSTVASHIVVSQLDDVAPDVSCEERRVGVGEREGLEEFLQPWSAQGAHGSEGSPARRRETARDRTSLLFECRSAEEAHGEGGDGAASRSNHRSAWP